MQQYTTKKCLFIIQPQSVIDVITNSSSELFIFEGKELGIIEEMIEEIYPEYLTEYESLILLEDLSDEKFIDYLDWIYYDFDNKFILSDKFNILPEILYSNLDTKDTEKYWHAELSQEGINLIKKQLNMDSTYLLYSIDENPNWEMQGLLWTVGQRIHLG